MSLAASGSSLFRAHLQVRLLRLLAVEGGRWQLSPNRQLWQLRIYLPAIGIQMKRGVPLRITNHFACCPSVGPETALPLLFWFWYFAIQFAHTSIEVFVPLLLSLSAISDYEMNLIRNAVRFVCWLQPQSYVSANNREKGKIYSPIEGSIGRKYSQMVLFTYCTCIGTTIISAWIPHSQLQKLFSNENEPICNSWSMTSSRHERTVHVPLTILPFTYIWESKPS